MQKKRNYVALTGLACTAWVGRCCHTGRVCLRPYAVETYTAQSKCKVYKGSMQDPEERRQ